jgi:hypothetical protein
MYCHKIQLIAACKGDNRFIYDLPDKASKLKESETNLKDFVEKLKVIITLMKAF